MVKEKRISFTFDYLRGKTSAIGEKTKLEFKDERRYLEEVFKIETELVCRYTDALFGLREAKSDKTSILFSAYWKNILTLFSAYELVNKGLFGPARMLARHSFEYLFLAKYCSVADDPKLLNKWETGSRWISLDKNVFEKIKKPSTEPFLKLWDELCRYSHASIYSMQIMFEEDEKFIERMGDTYGILKMLQRCNYHLLNSHLINKRARFYTELYSRRGKAEPKVMRGRIRELFKEDWKKMAPETKGFIRNYTLNWVVG
jgi:hypothetical protein